MHTYSSNPLDLIKPSFEAFKQVWVNLLLVVLASFGAIIAAVVLAVLGGLVSPFLVFVLAFPMILFIVFVGGVAGWTTTKLTIAASRGHKLAFKEALPQKFSEPWKYIWTCLLVGLAVGIGFILFIVPGIIFLSWLAMSPYILVDEGISGSDALGRSRELARGRQWDVLGAAYLTAAVGIVVIIPILGFIVYTVMAFLLIPVMAVRYNSILQLKKQPDWEKVPTHPLNYVVLAVALLASGISYSNNVNKIQQDLKNPPAVDNTAKPY